MQVKINIMVIWPNRDDDRSPITQAERDRLGMPKNGNRTVPRTIQTEMPAMEWLELTGKDSDEYYLCLPSIDIDNWEAVESMSIEEVRALIAARKTFEKAERKQKEFVHRVMAAVKRGRIGEVRRILKKGDRRG